MNDLYFVVLYNNRLQLFNSKYEYDQFTLSIFRIPDQTWHGDMVTW